MSVIKQISFIIVFLFTLVSVVTAGTLPDSDPNLLLNRIPKITNKPLVTSMRCTESYDFNNLTLDEAEAADELDNYYDLDNLLMLSQSGAPIDSTMIPAASLYLGIWTQSAVNPYKFNILSWKDTAKIDLRGYTHPFLNRITSEFGKRRSGQHYGIDIKLYTGDSVRCAFDGMVRLAKYNRRGYGNYVVVRHFNGLETVYAHFSKTLVKPNQIVRSGQVLGLGGNTGRSTGSHLHFEVRYMGYALNPRDLINFDDGVVVGDNYELSLNKNYAHEVEMSQTRYYTIKKGDTLSRIAMRNGVTVSKLCKLNGITTKTVLRIGRKIKISGPQ